MLWLPNAEVIVDNGVLRTAADAGLSRICVEIYDGVKIRWTAGKVGEVQVQWSDGGGEKGDIEVSGEGCLP